MKVAQPLAPVIRRKLTMDRLPDILNQGQILEGKVIGSTSGGFAVRAWIDGEDGALTVFVPLTQMLSATRKEVLAEDKRLLTKLTEDVNHVPEELDGVKCRSTALNSFIGRGMRVSLLSINKGKLRESIVGAEEPYRGGGFSWRVAGPGRIPRNVLEVLQENIGELVEGTVASAGRLGCILHIDVQSTDGIVHTVAGTVVNSEISWAAFEGAATDTVADVAVGSNVEAMLLSVDLALGRVELSIRRTLPDPKLASAGDPATEEAEVEEQDLAGELGNMAQVEKLCIELGRSPGVISATPAKRVRGLASAPELQVFMMRADADAEVSTSLGEPTRYMLAARNEQDVQEIEVVASLDREAMKEVLAAVLAAGIII